MSSKSIDYMVYYRECLAQMALSWGSATAAEESWPLRRVAPQTHPLPRSVKAFTTDRLPV